MRLYIVLYTRGNDPRLHIFAFTNKEDVAKRMYHMQKLDVFDDLAVKFFIASFSYKSFMEEQDEYVLKWHGPAPSLATFLYVPQSEQIRTTMKLRRYGR